MEIACGDREIGGNNQEANGPTNQGKKKGKSVKKQKKVKYTGPDTIIGKAEQEKGGKVLSRLYTGTKW